MSQPIISAFSERIEKPVRDEQAKVAELSQAKVAELSQAKVAELPQAVILVADVPTLSEVQSTIVEGVVYATVEEENESYILPPASLLTETPSRRSV